MGIQKDKKNIIKQTAKEKKAAADLQKQKNLLLESLEKSLCVVTSACKAAGVHRSTYYRWREEDPEFALAADELSNVAIDFVESQLYKQIKNGSASSTIFYLKTKGRKRGYIEKVENINRSINLNPEIDLSKLTDDELTFLEKISNKLESGEGREDEKESPKGSH